MAERDNSTGSQNALADAATAAKKIAATVETVVNFLHRIIARPADELSAIFSEQLKFWRAKNLNRIFNKYEELAKARPWHPEAIKMLPFGISVGIVEKASIEEDETLQSMWARLLVNATDPSKGIDVSKIHVEILSSITPVDAFILDLAWSWDKNHIPPFGFGSGERDQYISRVSDRDKAINEKHIARMTTITAKTLPVSLNNLLRLKLFSEAYEPFHYSGTPSFSLMRGGGFGTEQLDFDFGELGRLLDRLVEASSSVVDIDELCSRFFENQEGLPAKGN